MDGILMKRETMTIGGWVRFGVHFTSGTTCRQVVRFLQGGSFFVVGNF